MATPRNGPIRIVRVKKGDTLKDIYAKVRKSFTAADLQRYTETEEMFPAEELAKELEAMSRQALLKRKRTRKV